MAGGALRYFARTGDWRTATLHVFPRRLGRVARTPSQRALVAQALGAVTPPSQSVQKEVAEILEELTDIQGQGIDKAAKAVVEAAGEAPLAADLEAVAEAVLQSYTAAGIAHTAAKSVGPGPGRRRMALALPRPLPGRETSLTVDDYTTYLPTLPRWRSLFGAYDVVQGYATDGIIPLLANSKTFAAYEHGTLRDIPFEDSARGRICALLYRAAPIAFVTNSDVVPSARRLGLTEEQMVFLPHAVDSTKLLRFARDNAHLCPAPGSIPMVFSPARQDWRTNDINLSKGNDRLLRGLRTAVDRGARCRLTLVEWGRDVAASKALVSDLELDDLVDWVPTMKKRELWRWYLKVHCVVDQFLTPAIGGVTFEAMALGRRVITSLDVAQATEFFGESPPLENCSTDDEIAAAIERITADPSDETGRGAALQHWFAIYHSAERILDLQTAAYGRVLAAATNGD